MTRHLVDLYTRDKFSLEKLGECMNLKNFELRRAAPAFGRFRPNRPSKTA